MPTFTISSKRPVIVLDVDEYESMKETIDILSNPELMKDIEKGRQEYKEGKTISWDKLRKELLEDGRVKNCRGK
jgi:antitoxin YefM